MNHPLAYIHPDAKIGKNVKIEPFAVIYEDVEIGDDCWIGPHVTIFPGARIGKNNKIFPYASISAIPQDLKFAGEKTTVIIGDNNTIRESVTINRGTVALGHTKIGSNNLIMAYAHIAHDCVIGDNCVLANGATLAGHIEVGDYAIIGGLSAIHQFTRIGSHVILMGGSLVDKDVPPYIKGGKFPLSYCGINSVGLSRRGFDQATINKIKEYYTVVFQSGLNYTKAFEELKKLPETPALKEIIDFISKAERGLIKGFRE
ncbi:MAG: acyl-ACP--UDP-N-acetylglucosamine O-acyltransferase [Bacteroidales bacterium]|nr:acyl-ACP--UDP-N-acetylglucosamine O-acyltransferase [Bacteroidales bacterium]MDD4684520.1 acyl-ACP--UDP-N-acetylglucosamine O-acyltransferase [Bacteroidales bacterium]